MITNLAVAAPAIETNLVSLVIVCSSAFVGAIVAFKAVGALVHRRFAEFLGFLGFAVACLVVVLNPTLLVAIATTIKTAIGA